MYIPTLHKPTPTSASTTILKSHLRVHFCKFLTGLLVVVEERARAEHTTYNIQKSVSLSSVCNFGLNISLFTTLQFPVCLLGNFTFRFEFPVVSCELSESEGFFGWTDEKVSSF